MCKQRESILNSKVMHPVCEVICEVKAMCNVKEICKVKAMWEVKVICEVKVKPKMCQFMPKIAYFKAFASFCRM